MVCGEIHSRRSSSPRPFGVTLAAFAGLCLTSSHVASSEASVEQWLERMNLAVAQVVYSGKFVYQQGSDVTVWDVDGYVDDDGDVKCKYQQLDGIQLDPVGSTIRENPKHTDWMNELDQRCPFRMPSKLAAEHYDITIRQRELVCGRTTVVLELNPHDSDRNRLVFWLDEEYALPLRFEVHDPKGDYTLLEGVRFAEARFHTATADISSDLETKLDVSLEVRSTDDMVSRGSVQELMPQNVVWNLNVVPQGFTLTGQDREIVDPRENRMGLVYNFHDGVVGFSVIIERDVAAQSDPVKIQSIRKGAFVEVSKSIASPDDRRYSITLVGDVPEATAKAIIEGVSILDD